MAAYRYKISLRTRHPSRSSQDVTAALGIVPRYSWNIGDQRKAPNGSPIGRPTKENYWSARLAEGAFPGRDLPTAIAELLDRLAPHQSYLADFVADGGKAELFVGWYFPEGNSGDLLGFELLGRLAALRLDLSWDIYTDPES
jgi:hypothetical protein